ncbi:MAG TPA: rhomboid family intramembrane serine protease [Sphingomonadaceae bacterium]|nr:rhomboid family intramembrane serine protease [Sphingomonadaceae bacterium]
MRLPPARATGAIIGVTVAAWLLLMLSGLDEYAILGGGFIPERLVGHAAEIAIRAEVPGIWFVPVWATPLTATLLHAGLLHIGFNMLILGFCGRFVEASLGPRLTVLLYLIGAYAAALTHFLFSPHALMPMIGASGAASALLGAYALLFGQRRTFSVHPRLSKAINVVWLAAGWIGLQLLLGVALRGETFSIAIYAHIGGFLAGLILAQPLLLLRYRRA